MKRSNNKPVFSFIFSIFAFAAIVGAGAFSISMMRSECAREAKELKRLENEFISLRRDNEFWSTQIARSQDPAVLRKRAGEKLKATDAAKVVFAYQVGDPANPGKTKLVASYRLNAPSKTAATAQR